MITYTNQKKINIFKIWVNGKRTTLYLRHFKAEYSKNTCKNLIFWSLSKKGSCILGVDIDNLG